MSGGELLVVGSVNMDVVVRAERWPAAGETLGGAEVEFHPGGKGANQAVAAARAGARVRMVGRVGADAFGERLRRALADAGVDPRGVATTPDTASGTALILVDRDGENRIVLAAGANARVTFEDASESLASGSLARVLLQGEIPLSVSAAVARAARTRGAAITWNAAPAPTAAAADAMRGAVDHLVVNESEAARLLGVPELSGRLGEALHRLRERYAVLEVTLSLGARGALHLGEELLEVGVLESTVVDTTAAGDAFVGAFEASRCRGDSLGRALARASVAGGLACRRRGAQPSLPTLAELDQHEAAVAVHRSSASR